MVKRKKKKKKTSIVKRPQTGILNVSWAIAILIVFSLFLLIFLNLFYQQQFVKKILITHRKKPKRRHNIKILRYILAAVNMSIKECALRSGKQALAEDTNYVLPDHVEKVITQLVMDL